jgi:predicted lipoprotein with Yx(FWY)xxD motif
MKKAAIGVVIAVVVIGGGYLIFHKSPKPASTPASSSSASAPAVNNAIVLTKSNSSLGQYLTDPSGKALYTYGGDSSGVSNCTGSCLAAWPAYQDKGSTSGLPTGFSTITRTDNGQVQYTYMGLPLYYFASDSQGQVTGNGVDNFQVAKPSASSSSQPSGSGSTSSTPSDNSSSSSNNSSSGYPSY